MGEGLIIQLAGGGFLSAGCAFTSGNPAERNNVGRANGEEKKVARQPRGRSLQRVARLFYLKLLV